MTDDTPERRGRRRRRRSADGPVGRTFGWTLGPFGAAFGSVVDDDRFAFTFAFGTRGGSSDRGLEDATTIEVTDAAETGTAGPGGSGDVEGDGETADE